MIQIARNLIFTTGDLKKVTKFTFGYIHFNKYTLSPSSVSVILVLLLCVFMLAYQYLCHIPQLKIIPLRFCNSYLLQNYLTVNIITNYFLSCFQ
jgi:hypothetical protein